MYRASSSKVKRELILFLFFFIKLTQITKLFPSNQLNRNAVAQRRNSPESACQYLPPRKKQQLATTP